MTGTHSTAGAERPFFDAGGVGKILRTSDGADTAAVPPGFKPRVSPAPLHGWKCHGLGITGYGMSVEAAYASWCRRWSDGQLHNFALAECASWAAPNIEGKAFCHDPL